MPIPNLKPVMELETRIETIKKIQKWQTVSYGRTWKAKKDTYLATIPIGYADGIRRAMSNKNPQEVTEEIVENLARTKTNKDFIQVIKKVLLED